MFTIDTVYKVDATDSPRTWKNQNSNQSKFFNTDNIMRKPCDVADDILAIVSVSAVMTMTHTKPTEPIRRRRRRRKSMPLSSNIDGTFSAVENNNNNCDHHHELMPFEISQRYFHDFPDATTLPSESLLWDRYRRGVAEDKKHKEHYLPSTQPFQLPPGPSCTSLSLSSPSSSSLRRKRQKSTSKSQDRKTKSPTSEQSRPPLKPSYSDRIMALDLSSKSILSSNRI